MSAPVITALSTQTKPVDDLAELNPVNTPYFSTDPPCEAGHPSPFWRGRRRVRCRKARSPAHFVKQHTAPIPTPLLRSSSARTRIQSSPHPDRLSLCAPDC